MGRTERGRGVCGNAFLHLLQPAVGLYDVILIQGSQTFGAKRCTLLKHSTKLLFICFQILQAEKLSKCQTYQGTMK